jgi:DnaJ-class molecular chaperone
MAFRNYYVILGVGSMESDRGIRTAYRELVRRFHPDHAGPEGASAFREATEAYRVLADPLRRREYDDELARAQRPQPSEPFVRDLSMRRDVVDSRPSAEELFGRIERNFTGVSVPKGDRVQELQVDIAISREEAERGTNVRIGLPTFSRCIGCRGYGCSACGGRGTVEQERPVTISVPPMSGPGTTFVLPLSGLGIHNFYLHVRVRVSPEVEASAHA